MALLLSENTLLETLQFQDTKGNTSLHVAVYTGCKEVSIKIVERLGADDLGIQNADGQTVLHLALAKEDREMSCLLSEKASLQILQLRDMVAIPLVELAVKKGLDQVASVLMRRLWKLELQDDAVRVENILLEVVERRMVYSMRVLAEMMSLEMIKLQDTRAGPLVELALDKGLDQAVSVLMGRVWETELHDDMVRVEKMWVQVVERRMPCSMSVLVARVPMEMIKLQDTRGDTSLHVAAHQGFGEVVSIIIHRLGIDALGIQNVNGGTVLHMMVKTCSTEIALLLLEKASIETLQLQDTKGNTCLHVAVYQGCKEVALKIVERLGVDALSIQNADGQTVLHVAFEQGDKEMSCILSEKASLEMLQLWDKAASPLVELAVDKGLDQVAFVLMGRVWEHDLQGDAVRVEQIWLQVVEKKSTNCIFFFVDRGWARLEGKTLFEFATEKGLFRLLDVLQERLASEACEARSARIQENGVVNVVLGTNMEPLRTKIGLTDQRRDRDEWKDLLEHSVDLIEKPRDIDFDTKILCGDVSEDILKRVLIVKKRTISFLLSSTFTDTEWERNLIIDDVVPYLQEFARKFRFEFRLAEMRWGIRKKASSSHQVCVSTLNFILFLLVVFTVPKASAYITPTRAQIDLTKDVCCIRSSFADTTTQTI